MVFGIISACYTNVAISTTSSRDAGVLYAESTSAQTLRKVEVMLGAALRPSPQPFRRPSPQEQRRHAFR
jgi:hypothetical protein